MADAPAAGGGNGWGALEIILAIVLAIGLITTLTGNPINPVTGSSSTKKTATTKSSSSSCGLVITNPTSKQKVGTIITVNGTINKCLALNVVVPSAVVVHVVDSNGSIISAYSTISVSKSLFGYGTFTGTVQLTNGTYNATTAYVVVETTGLTARVPVILNSGQNAGGILFNTTTNNGSYFVPTTSTTQNNTNTNTDTNSNSNGGGGTAGSRTF